MSGIAEFLRRCERHPGRNAIIDGRGVVLTFGELATRSARTAAAWRRGGLARGDHVLFALPLGLELYVALAALWRLGAIVVLPEPALGLSGLRHAARAAQPKAVLATGLYRALRIALPELWRIPLVLNMDVAGAKEDHFDPIPSDTPALISFTSGSTGKPKAMVRTHGVLAAQNACVAHFLAPDRDNIVDLVAFPVFVLATLALGTTAVLPAWNVRRHDEASPQVIARQVLELGIDRLLVPPAVCEAIVRGNGGFQVGAILTGGGPVFPDLLHKLEDRFPDATLCAVYGSTEAEPIAHIFARDIRPGDWAAMAGGQGLLAGAPAADVQVKIHGQEIIVTGPHVNKGYLDPSQDRSTKLLADGEVWHRTGDGGRFDEDGRLWLLGRLDGRVGGLFPFAVEAAARTWPGVVGAALCGTQRGAMLAVEGDVRHFALWRLKASHLGDLNVAAVARIPLDRRHRSKVDYPALRAMLNAC
jgi:acyl-coenzyme A synthetase/AMP-(fatty) acid ligase